MVNRAIVPKRSFEHARTRSGINRVMVNRLKVNCVIVPMQSIEHARANPGINHVKVNGVMVDGY